MTSDATEILGREARLVPRARGVLGFIAVQSRPSVKFIEVSTPTVQESKLLTKALARHRELDEINGYRIHYARAAFKRTFAMGSITSNERSADLKLIRGSNVARHGAGRGGRLAQNKSKATNQDTFLSNDP
jgi:hypothetical protein